MGFKLIRVEKKPLVSDNADFLSFLLGQHDEVMLRRSGLHDKVVIETLPVADKKIDENFDFFLDEKKELAKKQVLEDIELETSIKKDKIFDTSIVIDRRKQKGK